MVESDDLVRRIGVAVAEYGLPFPPLTSDPEELWLLSEAVMARYFAMKREHEEQEARRADIERQKREWLEEQRARRGHLMGAE